MSTLRPYQKQALDASLEAYLKGLLRQVVVLPTAAGKTVIFSNLKKHHGFTKRILVLVSQEELAEQAADKLKRWNPELSVGVEMAASRAEATDDIVVASVQTLYHSDGRRLAAFDPATFDAIVADECHLSISPSWQLVFRHFGLLDDNPHKILLLGCTATPNRSDNQGLAAVYDGIVYSYSILQGIRDGWLADLKGYRVDSATTLDGVSTRAGDLAPNELSSAVNNKARNQLIVSGWKQQGAGKQTIVFCVDIAHAKAVSAAFSSAGVKSEAIWGSDPDRAEKIARLRSGATTVLCNCQILTTGFDCWQVACIVMARPTKSQLLYTQCLGRGLRIPENINNLNEARQAKQVIEKEFCTVIDVADTSSRHSLIGIPSIFGLPAKMKMNGKTVLAAVDKLEKVALTKPLADLKDAEDLDTLQAYAEKVDLLAVRYPQEVLDNSEFQWHLRHDGVYIITLPDKGWVAISPNALGWTVRGVVEGTTFGPSNYTELGDAFHFADAMLRQYGKRLLSMIRRNPTAKWCKDPISENQIKALKLRLNQLKMPEPTWGSMTKSDGVALHRKLYANITRKIA